MKKFVALARVSSREQEREGFSLDVQEEALKAYADREKGEIIICSRSQKRQARQVSEQRSDGW